MLCERTTEQALSERLNEYFLDGRVFEKMSQPVSARTLQLISEWSTGRRFASLCRQSDRRARSTRRRLKNNYKEKLKSSLILTLSAVAISFNFSKVGLASPRSMSPIYISLIPIISASFA